MSDLNRQAIEAALKHVIDPDSGVDVVSAGLISDIATQGGKVGVVIHILPADKERKSHLREACEEAIRKIPGVTSVTAVMTAQSAPSPEMKKPAVWNLTPVEHVRTIIAIGSGKGGVGKSTTAVNLAHAFTKLGKRTGLLDADIYGPSIPRMMALEGRPEIMDNKMLPLENHGIKCMSVGFITGNEAAILRGPMISKTLAQLLRSTRWGDEKEPLDMLLVDMPPGTGDVHLSLAQQTPLAGAVIVTTPQEVALADARKCLIMFQKVSVPVLGVIENMSGSIFGSGGGKKLADEFSVPFLGSIAMEGGIVEASDQGKAYAGVAKDNYRAIAQRLIDTAR